MVILMKIDLIIMAILMGYILISKDPKKLLVYLEFCAFVVFEVLFLFFHPVVGSIAMCGFAMFLMLSWMDKYEESSPTWWMVFVYSTLAVTALMFIFQLVEVFAGKLF